MFFLFCQLTLTFNLHADFKDDPYIYAYPNLRYVGIELWQVKLQFPPLESNLHIECMTTLCAFQVKAGSLFDNILVCDDPEYAKKIAEETWGKLKDVGVSKFQLLTVSHRIINY